MNVYSIRISPRQSRPSDVAPRSTNAVHVRRRTGQTACSPLVVYGRKKTFRQRDSLLAVPSIFNEVCEFVPSIGRTNATPVSLRRFFMPRQRLQHGLLMTVICWAAERSVCSTWVLSVQSASIRRENFNNSKNTKRRHGVTGWSQSLAPAGHITFAIVKVDTQCFVRSHHYRHYRHHHL